MATTMGRLKVHDEIKGRVVELVEEVGRLWPSANGREKVRLASAEWLLDRAAFELEQAGELRAGEAPA